MTAGEAETARVALLDRFPDARVSRYVTHVFPERSAA